MKIKRFHENIDEEVNISQERVGEMIEELKEVLSDLEDRSSTIDSYLNELENYQSKSTKGNDQIDDSISSFQIAKRGIDDSIDKIDNVINNLMSYNDEGRKYLYTETK
jgi:ABC-type transporter Mla subunit MlaD